MFEATRRRSAIHRTAPGPMSALAWRVRAAVVRVHHWLSDPPAHFEYADAEVYAVTNYCAGMCLLAHVLFGLVFLGLGVLVPALVNVGSVMLFAAVLALSRRGYVTSGVLLGCAEVLAHAWMATVYMGWATGFHYYVLLAIAIVYLFSRIPLRGRIVVTVSQVAAYVALALYAERHAPLVSLDRATIDGLTVMNILILCTVLVGMLSYYTFAVRAVRRQLRRQNHRLQSTLRRLEAAQDQIVAQQKLAHLGTLTAGIAHEIKNPLNFVNNFAALSVETLAELRADLERLPPELGPLAGIRDAVDLLETNASKIHEHGVRADRVVQSMLLHAGKSSGARELTDLNALVTQTVGLARSGTHADVRARVELTVEHDPELPAADVVPRDLARALLNIIGNAVHAASARARQEGAGFAPRVHVSTRRVGGQAHIRVRDNGAGIAPPNAARIFEPFFTTKPTGEGTGLGLSISHDIIVGQHKGRLTVESEPGQYAEFVIEVPLTAQ